MRHDLVKVRAEDRRQVQTDIGGTRYTARGGYFHLKPEHVAAHRQVGNLPAPSAALPVGRSGGYRCGKCGFGSFFVACSQCGGTCTREAVTHGSC